jgi:YbbR domain-containing protein
MSRLWEKIVSLGGSNVGLKVLSLVMAMGLWLAGHRDIERAVEVPVEFRNTPSDLMVMDNRVDYVVLRLMGPRTLVSTLDAEDLKLSLDLNGAKPGSVSYPLLGSSSFSIPRGVTVARINPPVIHLRLEPVMKRPLPVAVRLSNQPAFGYQISAMVARPDTVSVEGPAEEVKRLTSVDTLPVEVDQTYGVIKRKVRLSADGKPLSFFPEQVEVSVTVTEEEINKEFSAVDVRAKGFTGAYIVNPRSAYLRLSGPRRILGKLDLGSNQVYLDLQGLGVGEHSVPLNVSLPPEVKVLEQRPQRFRVRINKAGA